MTHHFDGRRFFDPEGPPLKRLWEVLLWRLTSRAIPWPEQLHDVLEPQLPGHIDEGRVAVTFIGHDTFLVQYPGLNLLTDPVWSERASPFAFLGPRRVRRPALALEDLPPIDAVLVSHNHYDHLDYPTLARLARLHRPVMVVPLGNRRHLGGLRVEVVELDWWEQVRVGPMTVTLTPAQHWSNRVIDRNRALWGGFWLSGPPSLFFAGDTGYRPSLFPAIRARMGSPQVSLLPVGTYEPRWFMRAQHMNPDDAARAHLDLGSVHSLGMHYGTFHLSDEAIDAPLHELDTALTSHGIPQQAFTVPRFGQTLIF